MTNYKTHKHYELAYRAHYNTSHTPEKRAEAYCADFDNQIRELEALDISAHQIAKFESLWCDWMRKKSNCISSMIAGPANFPTRRAEKANNAEHTACVTLSEYSDKITKVAKQEAYYKANPQARPIKGGDDDAIERLKQKLTTLQEAQDMMKAYNKAARKKGATLESLREMFPKIKKDTIQCFQPFELTNNNAKIKATEARIRELEKRKEQGEQEITINGVRVVQNPDDHRLQLFFDGKPAPNVIALLKSHAFKWSPRNGCWQRQLTNNALYAFKMWIKPELESQEAA